MAQPKCPKCEGKRFEFNEYSAIGAKFKTLFINCSDCGCIVGNTDFYNVPALIRELAEKLNIRLS